jgi:hypothetical protein
MKTKEEILEELRSMRIRLGIANSKGLEHSQIILLSKIQMLEWVLDI